MASINGIYTALSGMHAQRRVLEVTSHNIANESTPGFHRQSVQLKATGVGRVSAVFAGQGNIKGGVESTQIQRSVDVLAEARLLRDAASYSSATAMHNSLDQVENVFGEPSEDGIAALLDDFWSGWAEVASHPGDNAARNQLLENATSLIDGFHRAAFELNEVADTAKAGIQDIAVQVNQLVGEIAHLNEVISASATSANDLIDQRDLIVRDLAELTGAVSRAANNGQVDVTINGRGIVSGSVFHTVTGGGGVLAWENDGTPVNAPGGEAQALTKVIDDVVPRIMGQLDDAANSLVDAVNTLHVAGYDSAGNTGLNFFDPAGVTAASISLSVDVDGLPEAVAAGEPVLPGPTAPGPLDGEQARKIAQIAEEVNGVDVKYRKLITELGVEVRTAARREAIQEDVLVTTEEQAAAVGGVSLDEEMATMLSAQRGYEAAARVLTAIDEMLGFLIERTGVVGR